MIESPLITNESCFEEKNKEERDDQRSRDEVKSLGEFSFSSSTETRQEKKQGLSLKMNLEMKPSNDSS